MFLILRKKIVCTKNIFIIKLLVVNCDAHWSKKYHDNRSNGENRDNKRKNYFWNVLKSSNYDVKIRRWYFFMVNPHEKKLLLAWHIIVSLKVNFIYYFCLNKYRNWVSYQKAKLINTNEKNKNLKLVVFFKCSSC